MSLFLNSCTPGWRSEITDQNGDVWRPAAGPGRNGEPVYYPATGPEEPALTPSEIAAATSATDDERLLCGAPGTSPYCNDACKAADNPEPDGS